MDSKGSSRIAASFASLTGADVILYDYPGRGGTTVPATISAAIASGPAMLEKLRRSCWIGGGPTYAYGFSFGGSMAAAMTRSGGFAGLIIEGMVIFVRQQGLEKFVAGVVDPLAELCRDLIEPRLAFLRDMELPWTD